MQGIRNILKPNPQRKLGPSGFHIKLKASSHPQDVPLTALPF